MIFKWKIGSKGKKNVYLTNKYKEGKKNNLIKKKCLLSILCKCQYRGQRDGIRVKLKM